MAFSFAFQLRFLDVPGGIPDRYESMLLGSVAFVGDRQGDRLRRLRPLPEVVALRPLPRLLAAGPRAVAVASAILVVVFAVAKPFADSLPRSVVVIDFLLCVLLLGGARLAVPLIVERPARRRRAARKHEVLVVGAGSGGQMVVRELQLNPNLGATAIGFVDDDPRKRGMRMLGLKVLGTTDEIEPILDET